MSVKLHRCGVRWIRIKAHPCWRVEKALIDQGVAYEPVYGPHSRAKRTALERLSGQRLYPVVEFEDGTAYRDESRRMEERIRSGALLEDRSNPA